jgi:hypothetical protein
MTDGPVLNAIELAIAKEKRMPGGFTGNNSVDWFVTTDDSRAGETRIRSTGNYGLDHRGIAETNGGGYRFVITIKHPTNPKERQHFLDQLAAAAADKKSRRTILTIPVEDKQSRYKPRTNPKVDQYQITVDWQPPKGARQKPVAKKYKSAPIDITL